MIGPDYTANTPFAVILKADYGLKNLSEILSLKFQISDLKFTSSICCIVQQTPLHA